MTSRFKISPPLFPDLSLWLLIISAIISLIPEIPWLSLMIIWLTAIAANLLANYRLLWQFTILTANLTALLLIFLTPLPWATAPPLIRLALVSTAWGILVASFMILYWQLDTRLNRPTKP